jgi:CBS domain containing-hemolysin-like protein
MVALELALMALILAWNAFFVAAEYAFVAVRRTRLDELVDQGSRSARRVRAIVDDPPRFISTVQVAITFSSLALGAVGESTVSALLGSALGGAAAYVSPAVITVVSVVLAFALITALHVVLGEIVPKTLTLQQAEPVALFSAYPVQLFMTVFWPFIWVLRTLSDLVIRLLGLEQAAHVGLVHSEEELKMLVSASREEGVLEAEEQEMLYKVFDFAETEADQVMVPRPDVVGLPVALTPAEALGRALEQPFTRYPVYGEDLDDIVGVLHIRHLYGAIHGGTTSGDLHPLLRTAPLVPETKKLDELLAEFRRSKTHMAVVVDEYGSTVGIVTLEDVLEEIVGDIADEFDLPDRQVIRLGPDRLRIAAGYSIEEFNERFARRLPVEDYTTVGGFVFGELGRPARPGDAVEAEGCVFTVREVDGPRIRLLDVRLGQPVAEGGATAEG